MPDDLLTLPLPLPALPEAPLVSVLTASYNYARYLGRALESLLAQSYPHFEAVVCDDGSTDGSRDVAERYARRDPRIRLLAKENGGVASALNAAYRAARGEVVCLLDADDFFAPQKLARVVDGFRQRPESGLALHAMQEVDEAERAVRRIPFPGACETGWLAARVLARGGRWRAMPASALSFRRAVAERLFPIPEPSFRSEADGFLVTLAPLLTPVAYVPEVLAGYRLHGANLTGTRRPDRAVAVRRLDALRRRTEAVNARLAALGVAGPPMALSHNLNYREQTFTLALFDAAPRAALLRAYGPLARALLADDLYGPPRKVLGLVAYATAILLPAAARPAWLTRLLLAPGPRRLLQRAAALTPPARGSAGRSRPAG